MSFYWKSGQITEGKTASQIARETGRSEDAVRSAARRMGITLSSKSRGYSRCRVERAMRLIRQGHTQAMAARSTGVSLRTIQTWVKNERVGNR